MKIALINRKINIDTKSNRIVNNKMIMIKTGLTISIPVAIPILYPRTINAIRLNKIVIKRP